MIAKAKQSKSNENRTIAVTVTAARLRGVLPCGRDRQTDGRERHRYRQRLRQTDTYSDRWMNR